jgi:hypothetical protein
VRDDAPAVARGPLAWARVVGALAVSAVSFWAAPARAGEPVRLHWVRLEGAAACIDASMLEARVRQRLGSDPFDPRAQRTVEGVVRREGESWSAQIAVRAHPGDAEPPRRELKSQTKDCEALGEAVVLAVALAIDPEAAFSTPKPPAPPPPATAPAPPPPPVVVAAAPTSGARAGRAELGLAGQAGLLPRASFGASLLAAAALSAHFEIAARAQVFPAVAVSGDPSYSIGLALGDVRLCARRPARVEVAACGGPAAGVISAALLTGTRAQPGERAWFAAALGLEAALALGPAAAVRLGVEGVAPLPRERFTVEGGGALFRQSAVAGVAHAGVELRFGGPR